MDSSEINKMIQDIDFNDLYDDNYFSLSSKQDSNKGKVQKRFTFLTKVRRVFPMVVVLKQHVEFERNDHREGAPNFRNFQRQFRLLNIMKLM